MVGLTLLAAVSACELFSENESPVRQSWPRPLVIGFTPYYSPEQVRAEQQALVKYIGERLGLPARLQVAETYAELSSSIGSGTVHVADFSPFGYVYAKRENPGLRPLAIPIAGGAASYEAQILTHRHSGVQSVRDLAGKSFAFVDRRSTSGFLYPLAFLRSMGHEPARYFSTLRFAGNHEKLIDMLTERQVDAGATFALAPGVREARGLRVVATTGRIPLNVICAAPNLDRALQEKLQQALLTLRDDTDPGRRVLAGTPTTGFASADDRLYDEVRRIERLVQEENRAH